MLNSSGAEHADPRDLDLQLIEQLKERYEASESAIADDLMKLESRIGPSQNNSQLASIRDLCKELSELDQERVPGDAGDGQYDDGSGLERAG